MALEVRERHRFQDGVWDAMSQRQERPFAPECKRPVEAGNGRESDARTGASARNTALLTPWLSGLPNWERINGCCFQPLSRWSCVRAAIGNCDRGLGIRGS